ncbi:hypothetical protein ACHAWF_017809 [Thalassiosira exigua]
MFQERVVDSSEECTMARTLHYDACCFDIPSSPCQLCAHDEYMHLTTTTEFNDEEVTCRNASNYLQEREDSSSNTCSDAKASLSETCCYLICNIAGIIHLTGTSLSTSTGKTCRVATLMRSPWRRPSWTGQSNAKISRATITTRLAIKAQTHLASYASMTSMTMWR